MLRFILLLILALPGDPHSLCAQAVIPDYAPVAEKRGMKYHMVYPEGGREALEREYSGEQLLILQELNRRDLAHLARADSMIAPDTWNRDPLDYSPLPAQYGWAKQYPKALVLFQPGQVFGGYENGTLVRWGAVSSGRKNKKTPSGLFHLNWKSEGRHSTVNRKWFLPWYFNFLSKRGLSLHQYSLPGYPASHSCVRLLEPDARWLFEWGEEWKLDDRGRPIPDTGTPFLVIGHYDYTAPPPWLSPQWASQGVVLPEKPPLGQSFR